MRSKDDPSTNAPWLGDGTDSEAPSSVDNITSESDSSHRIMFDNNDGDVELQVDQALFRTRKCLLNKFAVLQGLIQEAESAGRFGSRMSTPLVVMKCDEWIAEDFNNTFKILYASVIEGPFEFDPSTLISALRIATIYDYPALRTFGIQGLERAGLSPVQRIRISQELDVPDWMEPACEELCNRQEPITQEEARIMGIDTLLRVSNMREQRRTSTAPTDQTGGSPEGSSNSTRGFGSERATFGAGQHETEEEDYPYMNGADVDDPTDEDVNRRLIGTCAPFVRVHVPKLSSRRRLEVSIPECACTDPAVPNGTCTSECRIPPCLFKILRSLQTEQASLAGEVMVLQTLIPNQDVY